MKILLYGEYWEGTHVDCISKVLKEKNISYEIFDFYEILIFNTKVNILNKILRRVFFPFNEWKINYLLRKKIKEYKPNRFIISKGVNIYPSTLNKIDESCKIINWNPDDFFNSLNSSKNILNSIKLYDYIFSARKHLFDEYKKSGLRNVYYLDWYYIPWLHKKPEQNIPIQKKIVFIGTHSKRREEIINSIFSKYKIEVWGSGWSRSKLNYKKNIKIYNKVLDQNEFPMIVNESYINLNILTLENRDFTNLKIFELSACGGLVLTEENKTSQCLLNNEGVYYNMKNLNEKIEYIFNLSLEDYNEKKERLYNYVVNNNNDINSKVEELLKIIK